MRILGHLTIPCNLELNTEQKDLDMDKPIYVPTFLLHDEAGLGEYEEEDLSIGESPECT